MLTARVYCIVLRKRKKKKDLKWGSHLVYDGRLPIFAFRSEALKDEEYGENTKLVKGVLTIP